MGDHDSGTREARTMSLYGSHELSPNHSVVVREVQVPRVPRGVGGTDQAAPGSSYLTCTPWLPGSCFSKGDWWRGPSTPSAKDGKRAVKAVLSCAKLCCIARPSISKPSALLAYTCIISTSAIPHRAYDGDVAKPPGLKVRFGQQPASGRQSRTIFFVLVLLQTFSRLSSVCATKGSRVPSSVYGSHGLTATKHTLRSPSLAFAPLPHRAPSTARSLAL
ncbi:hypothetical protein S40288_10573 [Stachybotrys chartarum IBT 40288]|nr:hypothetical protein S40288_10573 [Stachybotrys chartarum IBT 40288]